MFYVGEQITVTLEGSVWKPITCEFCQLEWAYRMTRQSDGTGSSPYFLDNQGAKNRASRSARQSLDAQLTEEIDPVWCPGCGLLQRDMFDRARFDEYGYWYLLAGIAMLVGVIFCAVWGPSSWVTNWFSAPGIYIFAAAILMAVYAKIRSRMFDPNDPVQVQGRKGKRPPNNVLLRADYETGMEAAIAKGAKRSALMTLSWSSKTHQQRNHAG